jgi:GR25 family glycosyltransferase involved in LPS biosynthesis
LQVRDPDVEDGKRGCFESHQAAARHALERGARRVLIFEDDVLFLPSFTPFAASRARRFLRRDDWEIFFLGHYAQVPPPPPHPPLNTT